MDLNRKQLSFLITFFSMSILVVMSYNIHLGAQEEDEYVIEMSLDEELVEELLEEKPLEEQANADPIKSHRAFNETAKPSVGNPEPLKTLDELLEEKAQTMASDDPMGESDGFSDHLKELAQKRKERKEQLGEKEAQKKEFTNNLADKRTSISYSLIDRNAYELPPPIYTCIRGGKVVINIKVDGNGIVYEASFNKSSSGTNDYCLIENAIAYARKARFSGADKTSQIGTITYLFQGK